MITQLTGQRVFEALYIIGFGAIWGLNFWWPGLLIDFGVAYGIVLLLRGRYWAGTAVVIFLGVLPGLYVFAPGLRAFLPLAVMGLGGAGLVRALSSEK